MEPPARDCGVTVSAGTAEALAVLPAPSDVTAPARGQRVRQRRLAALVASWWPYWRPALRYGLGLWLITRLAFLGFGIAVSLGMPGHAQPQHPDGWPAMLYYHWDSGYFRQIAMHGYFGPTPAHPERTTCCDQAFFPAYPLTTRYLAWFTGAGDPSRANYIWALAILAWVGTAVAAVCLWRLVADRSGRTAAARATVLLLAGPYAVFLMASYSEGFFLGFAVAAWLAATHRRWWLAGLLGAGAAFTRIEGVFLALALVVSYLQQERGNLLRPRTAAVLLPFLPVAGYFAWLEARTGRRLDWQYAEATGWSRHFTWPWQAWTASTQRVVQGMHIRPENLAEMVFAVLLVLAVVALVVLRRWPAVVYVGLTTAVLLTSTFYLSVPRATVILFPVTVLVAQWSTRRRWRWIYLPILGGSLVILAVNSLYFLHGHWAG